MLALLECVPNFSTSNPKVLNQILSAIISVPKIIILGSEYDISHNRSVITFAGPPSAVTEAAFQSIKKASELIDLNLHEGEHPRMGATDVCPLIPLHKITMEETIQFAKQLGKRVGTELNIPIYLYEQAATRPDRVNLADIRHDRFEGIRASIGKDPNKKPDFGPSILGPAGCTAIGAREPLIAYNINLNTSDVGIAKKIAKKIRERDGGLPKVKALGLEIIGPSKPSVINDRSPIPIAQVSMNLTDYKTTGILKAYRTVEKEAQKHGIEIVDSEIVGLIPEAALPSGTEKSIKLSNFSKEKVIENHIR